MAGQPAIQVVYLEKEALALDRPARVEVDDQYGIPLGRNVLEVARSGG